MLARWISMTGFEPAPAADPASCEVSLFELLVLIVPLAVAADGERRWEIAGRAVSMEHDDRGGVMIKIGVPLALVHPDMGGIDPAGVKKTRKKRVKGSTS